MGLSWRSVIPWVGLAGMVVVLPFYLSSGLVAPLWAIVVLLVLWVVMVAVGLRERHRRPWLLLLMPVVAVALWFGVISAGEAWLGWTA